LRRERPRIEAVQSITALLLLYGGIVYLSWQGYFWVVARYWLLPARIAVLFLAYTFDYIPHRPHDTPHSVDIYASTSRVQGFVQAGTGLGASALTLPLLYQNYHNVHHLYPAVPFYKYAALWDRYSGEMLQRGTRVVPFYNSKTPWW